MADIIRLKSYRTFMSDGRSSCTFDSASKEHVLVAVVLGSEPLKPENKADYLKVDDVILDMAKHIQRQRKREAKKRET